MVGREGGVAWVGARGRRPFPGICAGERPSPPSPSDLLSPLPVHGIFFLSSRPWSLPSAQKTTLCRSPRVLCVLSRARSLTQRGGRREKWRAHGAPRGTDFLVAPLSTGRCRARFSTRRRLGRHGWTEFRARRPTQPLGGRARPTRGSTASRRRPGTSSSARDPLGRICLDKPADFSVQSAQAPRVYWQALIKTI